MEVAISPVHACRKIYIAEGSWNVEGPDPVLPLVLVKVALLLEVFQFFSSLAVLDILLPDFRFDAAGLPAHSALV